MWYSDNMGYPTYKNNTSQEKEELNKSKNQPNHCEAHHFLTNLGELTSGENEWT